MMIKVAFGVAIAAMASIALGGCATGFYGSAPSATPGMEYVVGHQSSSRTMWLCPVGAATADCRRIEVQD